MKTDCKHENLRPSLGSIITCSDCRSQWRGEQAIALLSLKYTDLLRRQEMFEEVQSQRFHAALMELGLVSCDRCNTYFQASPNPKGMRIMLQGEKPEHDEEIHICRECLPKALYDESLLFGDDVHHQVARWFLRFYGPTTATWQSWRPDCSYPIAFCIAQILDERIFSLVASSGIDALPMSEWHKREWYVPELEKHMVEWRKAMYKVTEHFPLFPTTENVVEEWMVALDHLREVVKNIEFYADKGICIFGFFGDSVGVFFNGFNPEGYSFYHPIDAIRGIEGEHQLRAIVAFDDLVSAVNVWEGQPTTTPVILSVNKNYFPAKIRITVRTRMPKPGVHRG